MAVVMGGIQGGGMRRLAERFGERSLLLGGSVVLGLSMTAVPWVHAVPLLWRLHRVHHADLDYDVTTGARFHTLEILLSMGIKFAVIPQVLRERAEVVGEVVVSGRIEHLEVWNRERFDQKLLEEPFTEEDFRALAERGI